MDTYHEFVLNVYIYQSEMSFCNQTLLSSLGEGEGNKSHEEANNKILPVNQTCFDGSALKCTQMLCVQYSLILSILGILYFLVVGWLEFPRNKAPFSLGLLITRIPSMSHYKDTRYLSLRDTIIICMHYQCAQRMGQKQKSQDIDMN